MPLDPDYEERAIYTVEGEVQIKNCVAKTGSAAMRMVTPAAMLIFSGCSIGASRVQRTAATTTAVGPFGHDVANQNVAVIPTASAERIPVRTAGSGSDHRPQRMLGPANSLP